MRGGVVEKVEGDWDPKNMVIIEFESIELVRQSYHSPEYRDVVSLRHQSVH